MLVEQTPFSRMGSPSTVLLVWGWSLARRAAQRGEGGSMAEMETVSEQMGWPEVTWVLARAPGWCLLVLDVHVVKLPGKYSATIIKPKTNEQTKTHKKTQQKNKQKMPHKTILKCLRRCCQAQVALQCFIYQWDFLMTMFVWCGGSCGCRMRYVVNIILPPVSWCQ